VSPPPDRRVPDPADAASRLLGMDLVLTADCNLRCCYCYQARLSRGAMPWETLSAAIDLLRRSRRPEVTLAFYGGEPLLEMVSVRRGVEYASIPRPGAPRVRFQLTTNGILLDADAAAFLAARQVATRLSFDGLPAAQDRRARGSFARLDALLVSLRDDHPAYFRDQLEVAITVTAAGLPCLAESVRHFLWRGVRSLRISPRSTDDPDWDETGFAELDRQLSRVHRACLDHYYRTGQVPLRLFRRAVGEAGAAPPDAPCAAATGETLTVDVDGEVSACVLFAGSYRAPHLEPIAAEIGKLGLGRIGDPAFPRRLAAHAAAAPSSLLFTSRGAWRSSRGPCGECVARAECVICPTSVRRAPGGGHPRVPDLACAFSRVAARYRALFPPQPSLADVLRGRASPLPLRASVP
jgi:sulfatase maturation enzyme AslB (radical SAM superfamily)